MLKRIFLSAVASSVIFTVAGSSITLKEPVVRDSTIIFELKADAKPNELKALNSLINKNTIISKETINGTEIIVVKIKNIKGLEKSFADRLKNTNAVKFAEPDMALPLTTEPNDEFYGAQWHHPKINSPLAWDLTQGSENIKVCIIDTGVDTDHIDLSANLLLPGFNVVSQNQDVEDKIGHGTGTSGVVGAIGNNIDGVAGVNWNVGIYPIKVNFDDIEGYAYISDMVKAISHCSTENGKIANLSYGGANSTAIDSAATTFKENGGLLFMSSGNNGKKYNVIQYPDFNSFVAVGATDQNDQKASFSTYGSFIDITAPGVDIATTYKDNKFVYYSGTSFSSPMVAGVGALIYAIDPDFTPDQVEEILFTTATDIDDTGEDIRTGHGRIDAGAAIEMANNYNTSPNIAPVANILVNPTSGDAPLTVSFDGSNSSDEDGSIVSYLWEFGDNTTSNQAVSTHSYTTPGTYYSKLTVTDDKGATGSNQTQITVLGQTSDATLELSYEKIKGSKYVHLNWAGLTTTNVIITRKDPRVADVSFTEENDGIYTDKLKSGGTYSYKVCETNEEICTPLVSISF
ncbi:MAG: S8 family serine peptidase [Campylobacterota bacterium]|nr:S8 family serine peptidase [Campylobacterota bacterium]